MQVTFILKLFFIALDFWNPVKGINIQEIEQGMYMFQFNHHLDINRILKKGPWYFDNHLLLDVIPESSDPKQVSLQYVPFWIQVHDIPIGLMSEKIGKDIANYMAEFLKYNANNSNCLRSYMRIRVLLDVTNPLKCQKRSRNQQEARVTLNSSMSARGTNVISGACWEKALCYNR